MNFALQVGYGFALLDNENDSYGLRLSLRFSLDAAAPATDLGTFRIHRRAYARGGHTQFPAAIWAALSDPRKHLALHGGGGDDAGDHAGAEVEIDGDDVQLLLVTLQQRLAPFAATAAADARLARALERPGATDAPPVTDARKVFMAMYRDGQRCVLEEAVETLEDMLSQMGAESQPQ